MKRILVADLVSQYPLNADRLYDWLLKSLPPYEGVQSVKGSTETMKQMIGKVLPPEPCRLSYRTDPATLAQASIEEFKEDIMFDKDEVIFKFFY